MCDHEKVRPETLARPQLCSTHDVSAFGNPTEGSARHRVFLIIWNPPEALQELWTVRTAEGQNLDCLWCISWSPPPEWVSVLLKAGPDSPFPPFLSLFPLSAPSAPSSPCLPLFLLPQCFFVQRTECFTICLQPLTSLHFLLKQHKPSCSAQCTLSAGQPVPSASLLACMPSKLRAHPIHCYSHVSVTVRHPRKAI